MITHHEQIEAAFAAIPAATSAAARQAAHKRLALLMTGHSIAEEAVLYPALARLGDTAQASAAYQEQSEAKVGMAALGELDVMSEDYLDKVDTIRINVRHHVFEEEALWFAELRRQAEPALQGRLTRHYKEEFERYVGATAKG